MENQIQRKQAEAERLEQLKEDTLRKKKTNRKKTIKKYAEGTEEEDADATAEEKEN